MEYEVAGALANVSQIVVAKCLMQEARWWPSRWRRTRTRIGARRRSYRRRERRSHFAGARPRWNSWLVDVRGVERNCHLGEEADE